MSKKEVLKSKINKKTRIDFTLMEYREGEVRPTKKGSKKRSFFIEDLEQMNFKQQGDYFGIETEKEGWIYVIEDPWKVVKQGENDGQGK